MLVECQSMHCSKNGRPGKSKRACENLDDGRQDVARDGRMERPRSQAAPAGAGAAAVSSCKGLMNVNPRLLSG